jgi:hypothetical protein
MNAMDVSSPQLDKIIIKNHHEEEINGRRKIHPPIPQIPRLLRLTNRGGTVYHSTIHTGLI